MDIEAWGWAGDSDLIGGGCRSCDCSQRRSEDEVFGARVCGQFSSRPRRRLGGPEEEIEGTSRACPALLAFEGAELATPGDEPIHGWVAEPKPTEIPMSRGHELGKPT